MGVESKMSKFILHDHNDDGINRRGFLECMAWAGTGVVWTVGSGVLSSRAFGKPAPAGEAKGEMTFVQISDSHIGFNKPANPDVAGTLQATVDKINALPRAPEFIIHTGDLSHTSKPGEFDTMDQLLKSAKTSQIFYVPGEHDTSVDDGKQYLERYGKGTKGNGWYSFDQKGVHFVGLVNVVGLEHLGKLGTDQLQWLEADLKARSSSTPIVVFAHIPLWTCIPEWGWGTEDSAQALTYEALRVSDGFERPYPSSVAEGGGQRDFPYGDVHGVSATGARNRAGGWPDEGARRAAAERARYYERAVCGAQAQPGSGGFAAGGGELSLQ
jgi:Icc protein